MGVSPSLVRRDLCYFGQFGTPSRGYNVAELLKGILTVFEVVRERWVAWVGAERLRSDARVLRAVRARTTGRWPRSSIPTRPAGAEIAGMRVLDLSELGKISRGLEMDAAVVAVREEQAQAVAEQLVAAGVEAILNLTSVPLAVPERVAVQQADITTQLLLLSYRASVVQE